MNKYIYHVRDHSRLEKALKHARKRFNDAITLNEAQDAMAEVEIMETFLKETQNELICSIKSKEN